jgi:hypothetical protein
MSQKRGKGREREKRKKERDYMQIGRRNGK